MVAATFELCLTPVKAAYASLERIRMTFEYGEIFAERGAAYHHAMLSYPEARRTEFARLFECGMPLTGQRVLDLPSGGGYLRRHLPAAVELVCLELTAGFGNDVPVYQSSQPWTLGHFDHAVCLAALHHIEDQAGFLGMLLSRLDADGILHLADVTRDSGIARFLDDFIGRYNLTGHLGHYLSPDLPWFASIGRVVRIEQASCPWRFANESQMLGFCNGLFGLVDCPPPLLRDALEKYVGVHLEGSDVVLDWQLLYVDMQPA